jgi:hypothetical protein
MIITAIAISLNSIADLLGSLKMWSRGMRPTASRPGRRNVAVGKRLGDMHPGDLGCSA